ncbi:unnamed protein product [Owenia fusiformis]|uniref:Phospholysine phosphohistidine inorganic pyrophosphate phosphatase n=1 Tax=Owenia fusiformis TaxID=6347 RepID=A0A8J1T7C5_OWEFU|nr:unnamed protein product [Owenia fusiformis]
MATSGKKWFEKSRQIKGVLLDITGVLYNSGHVPTPIPGSIEAVKRLKAEGIPLRFCTNETQTTRAELVKKLCKLGFELEANEVFPPAPAMCHILRQRSLRPHLLVHPALLPDFQEIDQSDPNCVVLGDAADVFSYENLNKAFQVLISLEKPVLFSMGGGKYYKENDSLVLDVGCYMKALEFATGVKGEICGKPDANFFNGALADMFVRPEDAIMIGDDIVNDVGGAQACGMMGLQVRTGKFRPSDENHPTVTPDGYVDNLAEAVDLFLANRQK